jgi:hypothetical protein
MVKVGSQKHRRMFLKKLVLYLACSQIWLNLPEDHHHFGYNTKFTQKKKKTPITLPLKVNSRRVWIMMQTCQTYLLQDKRFWKLPMLESCGRVLLQF